MKTKKHSLVLIGVLGISLLLFYSLASADPPGRVARLSFTSGNVSFAPANVDQWVDAKLNRPLTNGDRLWADSGGRVELQLDQAFVRLGESTQFSVLNIDNKTGQFELDQGMLYLHVIKLNADQSYEVDTPNLAFSVTQPGNYRIDVANDGSATTVKVLAGQGTAFGQTGNKIIAANQMCSFSGINLTNPTCGPLAAADDFDNWNKDRDQSQASIAASPYVSPSVIGASDLAQHGKWKKTQYGEGWTPAGVGSDWTPYSEGSWSYINPWGWTWNDDEDWGFAPYHYGRWAFNDDDDLWYWYPGPVDADAIYAPALVGFLGDLFYGESDEGIGWFPLGPDDVYSPDYDVSPFYFSNINLSNTFLKRGFVRGFFHNSHAQFAFKNMRAGKGITAMPKNAFLQSQSVTKWKKPVTGSMLANKNGKTATSLQPTNKNILGGGSVSKYKPTKKFQTNNVIMKNKLSMHKTGMHFNSLQVNHPSVISRHVIHAPHNGMLNGTGMNHEGITTQGQHFQIVHPETYAPKVQHLQSVPPEGVLIPQLEHLQRAPGGPTYHEVPRVPVVQHFERHSARGVVQHSHVAHVTHVRHVPAYHHVAHTYVGHAHTGFAHMGSAHMGSVHMGSVHMGHAPAMHMHAPAVGHPQMKRH